MSIINEVLMASFLPLNRGLICELHNTRLRLALIEWFNANLTLTSARTILLWAASNSGAERPIRRRLAALPTQVGSFYRCILLCVEGPICIIKYMKRYMAMWRASYASRSLPLAIKYFGDSCRSKTTNRKINMPKVMAPLAIEVSIGHRYEMQCLTG